MKGIKIGRLKINLLLIPAVIIMVLLGMGEAVLAFIPALILHEWAHLLAASAFGVAITGMELFPFGCTQKIECFAMPRSREIIVAAAGPAANMAAASIIFLLDKYLFSIAAAEQLVTANVAIAAVNMLPALPLDGGRIAKAVFSPFLGSRRAARTVAGAGVFFAAVITVIGIYAAVQGALNPSLFIMGFFLGLSAIREMKNVPFALIRDFTGKREAMGKRGTLCVNRVAAMQGDKISDVMKTFEAGKYNIVTVLGSDFGVVGELDERQVLDGMMQKGTQATLRSLCRKRA